MNKIYLRSIGGIILTGENGSSREKSVAVPYFILQIDLKNLGLEHKPDFNISATILISISCEVPLVH